MFLVLIEYTEDEDEGDEWFVVAHSSHGVPQSSFPTREAAEAVAMELAEDQTNRFAVVQIKSWFQQEVPLVRVVEKRIG
jgi:hypothetical protein